MSVVPQQDSLVLSFSEVSFPPPSFWTTSVADTGLLLFSFQATRVFNNDIASNSSNNNTNTNSNYYNSGTNNATPMNNDQSPTSPDRRSDDTFCDVCHANYDSNGKQVAQPQHIDRPGEIDTVGVIPPALPSRSDIANNPNQTVEIVNPRMMQVDPVDDEPYYNPWFNFRRHMRVYFAEFLGTAVLVIWGEGTQAQVVAGRKVPSDYISIAWGWGVGFMLAIYVSSGISGGHVNPAVTISLAVFRKFSWKKVPGYCLAQLLGGFTGGAVIYGVYYGSLHSLAGGFASVLTTGPVDLLPSTVATVFSVFTPAALLMLAISAFTDTNNNTTTPGMTPLLLGLIMVGIASGFGFQTGFVLNPARDLGPRLMLWAAGDSGMSAHDLWLGNGAYGIWIPTVGTIAGALFGNLAYDVLVYNGRDSPVNMNWSRRGRRMRAERGTNYTLDQREKRADPASFA